MSRANTPSVIVHGGAGRRRDNELEAVQVGCEAAAQQAWALLSDGASALDAVQAAAVVLEDDPQFNAGYGAALNIEGEVELDASIMSGEDLRAGAIAAVKGIRNAVLLARAVLEEGRHVLLVGEAGGRRFAAETGVPQCDPAELVTERQHGRWERRHGTVGCVARDREGRIAAATSTGGTMGKRVGRVGDSALIGCGTYVDGAGGVSCTGEGEAIVRTVLAKTTIDWLADGWGAASAAAEAVAHLAARTGGEAGLIVIDGGGTLGYAHNASHMPVAGVRGDGQVFTAV